MLELPVGTAKTRIRDGLIRLRDEMGVGRHDRDPRPVRRLRRRRARRHRARPVRAPPRRVRRVPGRGREPPLHRRPAGRDHRDRPARRPAGAGAGRHRHRATAAPRRRDGSGTPPSISPGSPGRRGGPDRGRRNRCRRDPALGRRHAARRQVSAVDRVLQAEDAESYTQHHRRLRGDPGPLPLAQPGGAGHQEHGAAPGRQGLRALARPRGGRDGARRADGRAAASSRSCSRATRPRRSAPASPSSRPAAPRSRRCHR